MSRRRLLIVDRYDAPGVRAAHAGGPDGPDILLLGLSNDWCLASASADARARLATRLVDPAPHAEHAAAQVGTFLVSTVAELPQRRLGALTLGELLARPEGTDWWLLAVTEKGPFRGPLVSQLYRVALARRVNETGVYDDVEIDIADQALSATLRGDQRDEWVGPTRLRSLCRHWLHAIGEGGRWLAVRAWLLAAGLRARAPRASTPGRSALAAFTFYPAWWGRPFSAEASDRFFSHLGEAGVTEYLTWLTSPLALWRNRRTAAAVIRTRGLTPIQQFVTLRDVWGLLSLRRFWRLIRFEWGMRPRLTTPFAGVDVGRLIAADISRSMTESEPCIGALMARGVHRRAAIGSMPESVLYRLEFQPFENALLRGLHHRARGIGFLHYPFGAHYLSTRFAPGEMHRWFEGASDREARPMPDRIIACGQVGIDHVTASGYPASRCAPCGPQRFGRLIEYRRVAPRRHEARRRLGLPLDRPVYLVTLAIDEADTEALFGALLTALADVASVRLVIRTHPNRPAGDPALQAALAACGPDRAVLMNPGQDVYDHMVAADAMICIGSMIAFEGMALGCMPVVFVNPSSFPALSLAEFDSALFVAHDAQSLSRALTAIDRDDESAVGRRTEWPAMLRRVLGDLETPLPVQLSAAVAGASTSGGHVYGSVLSEERL